MRLLFVFLSIISFSLPGFGQDERIHDEAPSIVVAVTDESNFDAKAELAKLGYESLDTKAIFDKRVIQILKTSLLHSKMDEIPHEERKALIRKEVKGRPIERIYAHFPRLLDLSAELFFNKDVIVGILSIFERKKDLKVFGYLLGAMAILGILVSRMLIPKKITGLRFLILHSMVTTSLFLVSTGIFYRTFKYELTPAVRIIKSYL